MPCPFAESGANRGEQSVVVEWFFDEVERAQFHGFDRERYVAMSRHHDHRHQNAVGFELAQEVDAAHPGHPHVRHDAPGRAPRRSIEIRRRRFVTLGLNAGAIEQKRQ
jgi:hypothetical protein